MKPAKYTDLCTTVEGLTSSLGGLISSEGPNLDDNAHILVVVVGSVALILSPVIVARMGERRGVYRVLVGKPEGKRPLGRTRRRWEVNSKLDLQEMGCCGYG